MNTTSNSTDTANNENLTARPSGRPGQWIIKGTIVAKCDSEAEAIALYMASKTPPAEEE